MYHDVRIVTLPAMGGLSDGSGYDFSMYKYFYLVPTSRPVINPPGIKTHQVEIPGANGVLDLTEVLTPYPLFQNRTGSLEFALLYNRRDIYDSTAGLTNSFANNKIKTNEKHTHEGDFSWAKIYSDLMNKVHGRRCRVYLEDEPEWFYQGRLAVNSWKSSTNGEWPTVTLDYDFEPYKLSVDDVGSFSYFDNTILDANGNPVNRGLWKWDPFSFSDGVIYNSLRPPESDGWTAGGLFKNIIVNTDSWKTYAVYNYENGVFTNNDIDADIIGFMPVCPTVTVTTTAGNSVSMRITNPELGYTSSPDNRYVKTFNAGSTGGTFTYLDPGLMFYDYRNNGFTIEFKGHGTISLSFRKGSL